MNWAAEQFAAVQLGDKRLNSRLVRTAEQLARMTLFLMQGQLKPSIATI